MTGVEVSERLNFPGLSGKPGEHATFDIGQVGYDKVLARRGHNAGAQAGGHKLTGLGQIFRPAPFDGLDACVNDVLRERRAREVLQLHEAPCITACACGSAELETSAHAIVGIHAGDQLFVFGRARLSGREAHPEQFLHGLRNIFVSQAALDRGAGQIRELDVVL